MKSGDGYFLVSQEDVDRIDSLINALALAIMEILESRPVLDLRSERTVLQQQYDELIAPHLYPEQSRDRRGQSKFEF